MSVQNIQRNPQDTSSFYLAHIYQQLSTQSNGSQPSIPSSLTNPIEPFIPSTSDVWANGLWFLSLVISLTCALVALLLQQWARRYLQVAYPRCNPHKQARIRAFYKYGVEERRIPLTIEVIPVLLHIALFLFFAGLSVFLFGLHRTIFKVVTAWIGVCIILYAYLTVLPIIHKNSPCSSPFSSPLFLCLTGIRYLFFRLLHRFPHIDPSICMPLRGGDPRAVHLENFFSYSMSKTAEEYALGMNPFIDYRTLLWTFQSLHEDSDFEKFFEGLPRLCDSETGKSLNLQQGFIGPNKRTLSNALIALVNRTLSSGLTPEFVKQRRLIICSKVLESTSLFGPWWILRHVLLESGRQFLGCIEFGLFVQNWKDIAHPVTLFYRQCVAAQSISIVRDHDERWYQLASGLLDVSNALLDKYIENGDSIQLANAISIVRRTVQTYSGSAERHRNDIIGVSSKTLETTCKLDMGRTLSNLQHEFCGVWNQLVATAQSKPLPHHGFVATTTLKNIRKLYIALHECSDTRPTVFYTTTDDRDPILDNPRSYPMCTIDHHLPSHPIPDLQFEPIPDDGLPTPNLTPMLPPTQYYPSMPTPTQPYPPMPPPTHHYPPIRSSTFPIPLPPSVITYPLLGAPPPDAIVHFPQPELPRSHAPVQPGVIVRSPPSPPRVPTSLVPSVYLDNASTASHSSGGHGQSSQAP